MTDVQMPGILEFMQTETMSKGRVRTTLMLFLLDIATFHDICARYLRSEITTLEVRVGTSIKHPKDKHDKKVAKAEAAKKFKKEKFKISGLFSNGSKTSLQATGQDFSVEVVCDNKGIRIYAV